MWIISPIRPISLIEPLYSPLYWRGVGGEDKRFVRRGKIQVTEILKEQAYKRM